MDQSRTQYDWVFVFLMTLLTAFVLIMIRSAPEARDDNASYIFKALQISHGIWQPDRKVQYGWSCFLGGIYWFLGVRNFMEGEKISFITSGILSSLTIPIFYKILRRNLTGLRLAYALMLWITFCFAYLPASGYSEPLYTVLILLASYLLVSRNYLILSAAVFGLAFIVRMNGIIFWASSVIYLVFKEKWRKSCWIEIGIFTFSFWLVASPVVLVRSLSYGHPLSLGYLPGFWVELLHLKSWAQLFHRLISIGLIDQLLDFFRQDRLGYYLVDRRLVGIFLIILLAVFPVWIQSNRMRNGGWIAWCYVVVGINMGVLAAIWARLPVFRYWVPCIPFIILPLLVGWESLSLNISLRKKSRIAISLAMVVFFYGLLFSFYKNDYLKGYHRFVRKVNATEKTTYASLEDGPREEISEAHKEGIAIATFLDQNCRHGRILNIGAGGGTQATRVVRHFEDVTIDPLALWGDVFSPSRDIHIYGLNPSITRLDQVMVQYHNFFTHIMIDPNSLASKVTFPNLNNEIKQPRFAKRIRKIYETKLGTTIYEVHP